MRNSENRRTSGAFQNSSASESKPPVAKPFLAEPFLRHGMLHDGQRLIPQALTGRHQAIAKFCIFPHQQAAATTPQISSKHAMFIKHLFAKSHIGAVWRPLHLACLISKIE